VIGGPAVTHGATYEKAARRGERAIEALIAAANKHHAALPVPHVPVNA
jgi:predicted RNase H-like HicB family nuclease